MGTIVGYLELVDMSFHGWALERDLDRSIDLKLYIDGSEVITFPCDIIRTDLHALNLLHNQAGFQVRIPEHFLDGRVHVGSFKDLSDAPVLLSSVDGPPRDAWEFCVPDRSAPASQIVGFVESHEGGNIVGWMIDNSMSDPAKVRLFVDNIFYINVVCDVGRLDVMASQNGRLETGFKVKMPPRFFDGKPHSFFFCSLDGHNVVTLHNPNATNPGLINVFYAEAPRYVCLGRVDGLQNGAIKGWCFVLDRLFDIKYDCCEIIIKSGGQIIGQITASQPRADVAAAFGSSIMCGFSYVPPPDLAIGRTLQLVFTVAAYGLELPGSPLKIDFLNLQSYAILKDLLTEVDELFTRTWKIRTLITNLIPKSVYNLNNYHFWCVKYLKDLANRCQANPLPETVRPLVSIICPTYKPRLNDFYEAVRSVIEQTYRNWELIIVDDASNSEALTNVCRQFVASDRRVIFLQLTENAGISGASNVAVEHAQGEFIVLFDHDDLLVPQAVEVLLQHQVATGAKMLYSDEDKVDDDGQFSEVHPKPDWNYRLILSQNYVCHLLMVEHIHLKETGPFRSAYDGAQDHDLILRLSEGLNRSQIVHVPEILYHWRKTPSSTAASGASKAYAVSAGARCIEDHLARRGLSAVVKSLRSATIYNVCWDFAETPSITVIIPYREQISVTRRCLTSLLNQTDYADFSVVLADNWSDSAASIAFRDEFTADPRVRYMRVAERFNYSRINNLAAAATQSQFLLFLNNDVITIRPDWMRLMVNELLASTETAIVGIKLLYPNGLVQHGGVVLGVGGIADHAHRLLGKDEPGYMARAICAQEITAVTAACLLCRRSMFEAVGGFDEKNLHVAYNDVDLCLRAGAAGHKIIWIPHAVAEHHESLSRGNDLAPSQQVRFFHEHEIMIERWRSKINNDPNYHPRFSRRDDMYLGLSEHFVHLD